MPISPSSPRKQSKHGLTKSSPISRAVSHVTSPTALQTSSRTSMHDLPVELLYEIMLLSRSSSLPMLSHYFHRVFSHSPTSFKVEFILVSTNPPESAVSSTQPIYRIVERWLSFPICTLTVLQSLERRPIRATRQRPGDQHTPRIRLPRHFFKPLRSAEQENGDFRLRLLTMLQHLFMTRSIQVLTPQSQGESMGMRGSQNCVEGVQTIPLPDPNSRHGYPLTKSVQAGDLALVDFLLEKGADPWENGALAIKVAISQKNMHLVMRLLGDEDRIFHSNVTKSLLETAINYDAGDIAEFLVKKKGYVPDMRTMRTLTRKK